MSSFQPSSIPLSGISGWTPRQDRYLPPSSIEGVNVRTLVVVLASGLVCNKTQIKYITNYEVRRHVVFDRFFIRFSLQYWMTNITVDVFVYWNRLFPWRKLLSVYSTGRTLVSGRETRETNLTESNWHVVNMIDEIILQLIYCSVYITIYDS